MPRLTPSRGVAALRNRLWMRRELCIFICSADRVRALPNPRRMHRDRWDDLAKIRAWSYAQMTREQYLAVAEDRRRSGADHLYSLVEDGALIHYGWLTSRQERAPDAALGLVFVPPPGSAALWDYFTDPAARGRGLYRDSLRQCMHDAVELDGARQVLIYVYADNAVSRHAIEKAGFEYYGSLVLERRLFRMRRYATFVHTPLDVRLLPEETPAPVIAVSAPLAANG